MITYPVHNSIWQPADTPKLMITNLSEILKTSKYEFMVSLSPFIYVSVRGHGSLDEGLPPQRVEPNNVSIFNDLIRGQCKIFTLARDRESLEGQD